jgi:hypothetical protein
MMFELEAADIEEMIESGMHRKRVIMELQELKQPTKVTDGPMVDWLNSLNVRNAEQYTTTI